MSKKEKLILIITTDHCSGISCTITGCPIFTGCHSNNGRFNRKEEATRKFIKRYEKTELMELLL